MFILLENLFVVFRFDGSIFGKYLFAALFSKLVELSGEYFITDRKNLNRQQGGIDCSVNRNSGNGDSRRHHYG